MKDGIMKFFSSSCQWIFLCNFLLSVWSLENWTKQIKLSCGWHNNFFESIILDGSSDYCHKISCWNSRLNITKYRDTTLEKILKFSMERVSDTVLYEYRRVNSIIYLTINSVSRRSYGRCIMIRILSCETALTHAHKCWHNAHSTLILCTY